MTGNCSAVCGCICGSIKVCAVTIDTFYKFITIFMFVVIAIVLCAAYMEIEDILDKISDLPSEVSSKISGVASKVSNLF